VSKPSVEDVSKDPTPQTVILYFLEAVKDQQETLIASTERILDPLVRGLRLGLVILFFL
jgi:hypothetical protein